MYLNNCYKLLVFLLMATSRNEASELKVTDQVFMDVSIEDEYFGRIILGLFGDIVPNTVKNFKEIVANGINGKSYVGTRIHTAIKKVLVLGGDIVNNDGTGSISIYGEYFDDESFEVKPNAGGLLVMANKGVPNTNGCQFFIITMPAPWIENTHVVFGKVTTGIDVIHRIERLKTDVNDKIWKSVIITNCGIIETKHFYTDTKSYEVTFWAWIKAGWFPLSCSFALMGFFQYLIAQLNKYV